MTAVVVMVTAVLAIGCARDPRTVEVVPGAQESVVLVAPPADSAGEAIVGGTLVLIEGGCVGLRVGEEVELAVWPSGTTPLADEPGVDLPRLGAFALGDEVRTGGGYGYPDHVREVPGLPEACLTEQVAYPSGY